MRGEWRVVEVQETGETGYVGRGYGTEEEARRAAQELRDLGNECRYSVEWLDLSDPDEPEDQFLSDSEADADVLRSAGWGMDEEYGGVSEVL